MIYTFIPFSINKNIGDAYNRCMDLIGPGDWAAMLDHDCMFVCRDWYPLLLKAVKKYPQYGLFTCYANRVGTKVQRAPGVSAETHDILYHRQFAKKMGDKYKDGATDLRLEDKKRPKISGYFMLVSKKTWQSIGGATRKGMSKIDWHIVQKCVKQGIKVARIDGLYVYHYRRGLGEAGYG